MLEQIGLKTKPRVHNISCIRYFIRRGIIAYITLLYYIMDWEITIVIIYKKKKKN